MEAGCTHFFTKPVWKTDLLQLLLDIFSVKTEKGLQKPLS
jgi:YesN/AraC family two-component response regulator